MRFQLDLVLRFFGSSKNWKSLTTIISILGIALGVGCLIAAMAGFSGFESTLKRSVTDLTGHVNLMTRGSKIEDPKAVEKIIRASTPELKGLTAFGILEGAVVSGGKMNFILLHGLDPKTTKNVSQIEDRVLSGNTNFGQTDGIAHAVIGSGLAEFFALKTGDLFTVVLPNPARFDSSVFSPKAMKFRVQGIVDLGKYEHNMRTVLTDLKTLQKFGDFGSKVSGFRLRLEKADQARDVAFRLSRDLGSPFFAKDWQDLNQNLFSAIEVEKVTIFFVMMIIIIAAAFNVATTLFVSVMKRYPDISLLKAMGAKQMDILKIFVLSGMLVGTVGASAGVILGLFFVYFFEFLQNSFQILPAEIYKLSKIQLEVRFLDVFLVLGATYLVCFLSTIIPAYRGSKLSPVEGLKYE